MSVSAEKLIVGGGAPPPPKPPLKGTPPVTPVRSPRVSPSRGGYGGLTLRAQAVSPSPLAEGVQGDPYLIILKYF